MRLWPLAALALVLSGCARNNGKSSFVAYRGPEVDIEVMQVQSRAMKLVNRKTTPPKPKAPVKVEAKEDEEKPKPRRRRRRRSSSSTSSTRERETPRREAPRRRTEPERLPPDVTYAPGGRRVDDDDDGDD